LQCEDQVKIDIKDVSVFSNPADALVFFVDDSGNAPKQATIAVPDICQVAQMMFLANCFPEAGLVFTTLNNQKIIVSRPKSGHDIIATIFDLIQEYEIKSVNIAPTDFFDSEIVAAIQQANELDVTMVFCKSLT